MKNLYTRAVQGAMAAIGCAAIAIAMVPAPAFAGSTLVVDDNGQCPGAAFGTIGAAVAAAAPGDTVQVCAGIYPETVRVDKSLTFTGAKVGVDGRTGRGQLAQESVVVSAAGDFVIAAGVNDVTIDGFTLRGAGSDAAGADAIEAFQGSSGLTVLNNVIRDNQLGINMQNPDGAHPARISRNAFINNSLGTTAEGGTGVFISNGPTNNTSIDHNRFTGHRETAINFAGSPSHSQGLVVLDNSSTNDSTFVVATNSDNALIDGNTVSVTSGHDNGSGILDFGGNTNLRVAYNILKGGAASGTTGIRIADFTGAPSIGTTVVGNKVSNRFNGIRLTGANTSAFISGNTVSGSANSGIDVEAGSNNVIIRNDVSASGSHDCADTTIGSGTAGTANLWRRDVGSTHNSSPAAICP